LPSAISVHDAETKLSTFAGAGKVPFWFLNKNSGNESLGF
jgi:hypothetical protein